MAVIQDGATVVLGGFGTACMSDALNAALIAQRSELAIVNNNAGNGEIGLAALIKHKRVRKIVCSFPRQTDSQYFDIAYHSDEIELKLAPQGNLAAPRPRRDLHPHRAMAPPANGKETRERHYMLELVMMELLTKTGRSKLVTECNYSLTGLRCVSRVYIDLGVFAVGKNGITVIEPIDVRCADGDWPSIGSSMTSMMFR